MADVPHLSLPLRMTGDHLAVVDQDTVDELANNVRAIVSFVRGERPEDPGFGIEPILFGTVPLNLSDIEATIAVYEPRATVNVSENFDVTDPTADRVSIEVTMPGDAVEEA